MHIILMLALIISGCALGSNVTWLLGGPVVVLGLLCFDMGTPAWRDEQEGYLILLGLGCGAFTILANVFG